MGGRLAADGVELEPIDLDELPVLDGAVGSVAVRLLHADLDAAHEQAVAVRLRQQGHDVCCSHEVSPEIREYERTSTTVVNANLRPVCGSCLRGLDGAAGEVLVLTSAGGLAPAGEAAEVPGLGGLDIDAARTALDGAGAGGGGDRRLGWGDPLLCLRLLRRHHRDHCVLRRQPLALHRPGPGRRHRAVQGRGQVLPA